MPITVESRAIHISPDLPDMFVTTAYSTHVRESSAFETLVTSAFTVPAWASIRRDQLFAFWNALPNFIHTDFPNMNIDRGWLEDDAHFVRRLLELQLEGEIIGPVGWPEDLPHFPSSDPFLRVVEYCQHNRKHVSFPELNEFSHRQVVLYSWALARLHGVYVGKDQTCRASEALEQVYAQDIPISHSPGLEGVTLKELASKGAKSACFFPLIAGIYGGIQSLLSANLLLAFQILGVGSGMTLCAVSTLWLADKLFAEIKHIGQDKELNL
ncbi:hypothetical protein FJZ31_33945 [Candidatus Poribacteria bacterium]|nr:hypothetical protein [Candidatus Poribacteria bacterium]